MILDIPRVSQYLLDHGWAHERRLGRGAAALWSKNDHLVVLPLRSTLSDYQYRIREFIQDVAEEERRSEIDVFRAMTA